jgi:hypothetical protein
MAAAGPGLMNCLVIIPSHADILASEGWNKAKIREYLMKRGDARSAEARLGMGDANAATEGTPRDALMILVSGGPGAWFGLHKSVGGGTLANDFVTTKIQFPKNWNKLVEKYKNVVPTHDNY